MSERVLSGSDQGYDWRIEVGGSDDDFSTMLHLARDGRQVYGGGMGGPKLYPGSVINEFRGRQDELPYVILARTAPTVDRVVATTDQGLELELPLSEVIHGLRFAAALLPAGHAPGSIRAESAGATIQTARQWMPPERVPRSGSGWLPTDEP